MKWACLLGPHLTPDEVKAMASCSGRIRETALSRNADVALGRGGKWRAER